MENTRLDETLSSFSTAKLLLYAENRSRRPLAQLLEDEGGAQVLSGGTAGVYKVCCVDAGAVGGVADAVTL
jgi:hypothetical protein